MFRSAIPLLFFFTIVFAAEAGHIRIDTRSDTVSFMPVRSLNSSSSPTDKTFATVLFRGTTAGSSDPEAPSATSASTAVFPLDQLWADVPGPQAVEVSALPGDLDAARDSGTEIQDQLVWTGDALRGGSSTLFDVGNPTGGPGRDTEQKESKSFVTTGGGHGNAADCTPLDTGCGMLTTTNSAPSSDSQISAIANFANKLPTFLTTSGTEETASIRGAELPADVVPVGSSSSPTSGIHVPEIPALMMGIIGLAAIGVEGSAARCTTGRQSTREV